MVYQHHRREGSAGVAAGPARRLDPRGGPTPVGLGTSTTPGAGLVRSGWQGLVRRHGGDTDEPLVAQRPKRPSTAPKRLIRRHPERRSKLDDEIMMGQIWG